MIAVIYMGEWFFIFLFLLFVGIIYDHEHPKHH